MISILPYSLDDENMLNSSSLPGYLIWTPKNTVIVLGRGSKLELAIKEEEVEKQNIPLYRRPSGGETVVLSPRTLCVSVAVSLAEFNRPADFFKFCNEIIGETLTKLGASGIETSGISDLSMGQQKLLGSSMYKGIDRLFYHAVLNVSEDPALFSKLLKHPAREPDYRMGRSHSEFVSSLKIAFPDINPNGLKNELRLRFSQALLQFKKNQR
ncbi:MAG: hypothetical protein Q7J34_01240 [Bacteroidales bacterium]|nr:hypothetical protein [Bacteroidales bacterium]